jgi:DNA invertase Pin-like site-specific DNA recombinase
MGFWGTVLVARSDRLISIVGELRRRGIGFESLHEALDTTTPGGRLVFHVFAALAEFIRELIVEGTTEGLAAARVRGVRLGRPPAMTPEQSSPPAPCSPSQTTACPRSPGCSA